MKRIIFLVMIFLCVSDHAFAEKAVTQKRPVLVKEIGNFHMITPRIMRGSQPKDKAFELLKEYAGVKTIIDLRNEKEQIEKEKNIVDGLGMEFISIPMSGTRRQTPATINKALAIITDRLKQPVFVHCAAGKDRTGMVIAAYRIKYDHWSQDDAVKEMLAYGYDRSRYSVLEKSLTQWKRQIDQ